MAGGSQGYGILQVSSTLTVAAIVIVVGVPLWWKTTDVYRAHLPYERIANATELLNPLRFTIDVSVESDSTELTLAISQALNTRLKGAGRVSFQYRVRENEGGSIRIVPESSGKSENVMELSGNALRVPFNQADVQETASAVVSAFSETIIVPSELSQLAENVMGNADSKMSKDRMQSLKSSSGYHLSFTLIVADPEFRHVNWNIEEAVEDVLTPFLDHLGGESFANFTIESQVSYYTNLNLPVGKDGTKRYVNARYLPEAISKMEARLSSHISQLPDINFVIYVPKQSEHPLHLRTDDGKYSTTNAFFVPQWGGVLVYNPLVQDQEKGKDLKEEEEEEEEMGGVDVSVDVTKLMPVFLTQLRALLGVPQPSTSAGLRVPTLPADKLHQWQLDSLLRRKLLENLLSSCSTLTSLVELLDKVQNMVVSDRIQQLVELAVDAIYESVKLLEDGRLHHAYKESVQSLSWAEAAFFDSSILELLYFPDDQKYGVYVPLFVPLAVPILMSLFKVLKWWRSSDRPDRIEETNDDQDCNQ